MRYFGNFNLELRYCGILQTCGMRFLYVLVEDIRYKNVSFTFFRPFIAVFARSGSTLKRPYFVTHFNLQFDCFDNLFKAGPLFPRSYRSFLPLFLLSRHRIHQLYRLTIKLRYFPIHFAVLRYLSNFFAVMRCSATPNVPLINATNVACNNSGIKFRPVQIFSTTYERYTLEDLFWAAMTMKCYISHARRVPVIFLFLRSTHFVYLCTAISINVVGSKLKA